MSNILFKNGIIVDGTGRTRYKGDLAIKDDLIMEIGDIKQKKFDEIIDINNKIISPGFIDTHSHSDLKILTDPYLEPKVRQGICTEILGQDGLSMAPLPSQYIDTWKGYLAGLDGISDENMEWNWKTTSNYLKIMEDNGTGPNVSYLVPHGNIRMEAMGLINKKADDYEINKMRDITRRALEAGAAGLSSGLIFMPCAFAETEELIELCKVVAEYDKVFVVHQRSEADDIINSMKEIIRIGRESGVKIHFSHFKVCGKKNWNKIDKVEDLLEEAKNEGIRVSFDQYPYIAGSTMLGVILPPWAHEGGTEKLLHRLRDKEIRKEIIYNIKNGIPGWDNFIEFAGLEGIYITSVKTEKNKDCIGKNLVEISKLKVKEDPYNSTLDLLLEEENGVAMYDYYGKEEHIIRFMQRPEQNFCTDGLLQGKPHPRVYGTFPRVLGKYVREEGALSLEEAIYKMTLKPASLFKFNDRGVLQKGKKADVVIFDADRIIDKSTFINPVQYPDGIEKVIINGKIILDNGNRTETLSGNVLRIY
jgi:N-acyl-D-amino-acid deacylase